MHNYYEEIEKRMNEYVPTTLRVPFLFAMYISEIRTPTP